MKILTCRLIAAVSVGLSGAVCAASESDDHQVTGTVVEVNLPVFVLETAKKERVELSYFESDHKPKVGEKVTVHYGITGRGWLLARKIENARQDR